SAVSQNSSAVENSKPMAGSATTTVLHTIQTAKARKSAGTEVHRLRRATAPPVEFQNASSSGRQSLIVALPLVASLSFGIGLVPSGIMGMRKDRVSHVFGAAIRRDGGQRPHQIVQADEAQPRGHGQHDDVEAQA